MPHSIRITAGEVSLAAELNDSPTAAAVLAALPIRASGNRWGEEIYFAIDVQASEADDARADMQVGELAFWPPGQAFCIFFGPTPASSNEQPRAASAVNPIGRVLEGVAGLRDVPDGAEVAIDQA